MKTRTLKRIPLGRSVEYVDKIAKRVEYERKGLLGIQKEAG